MHGRKVRNDDSEDIGINRKRLVRNRNPMKTKPPQIQQEPREVRCANPNCTFTTRKEHGKLFRVDYMSNVGVYCTKCVESIEKKWTCPYCRSIYTDIGRSAMKDVKTWINCDNRMCGRWTHLECEQEIRRLEDLKLCIEDENHVFYCSDCFESNLGSRCEAKEPEGKQRAIIQKAGNSSSSAEIEQQQPVPVVHCIHDLRSVLKATNKYDQVTNQPFYYLYSESYETVGRLLTNSRMV